MDQESMTLFSADEAGESDRGAAISAGNVWAARHSKFMELFSFAGATEHCSTAYKPSPKPARQGRGSFVRSSYLVATKPDPQVVFIQWVAGPCDEAAGSFGQPDDRVLDAKMGQDGA
jgi:phage-related tail fiber protein